jgi:protein phosphatase-4 regulatory subunit 3
MMALDSRNNDNKKRVKVYKMIDSVWDDQGTGYVEFSMLEPFDYPGIVVKSEDESVSKYLLKTKVSRELNIYVRQQDTLIVWNEASETDPTSDGTDLAISFQEAEGCQEFWIELHEIQNTLNADYSLGDESCVDDSFSLNNDDIEFPVPSMNNLDSIMSLFDLLSPLQCKIMANAILTKSFLPSLFTFFKSIELNQSLALKKAYYILKKLFSLNSRELLDQLSDIYFFDVLYILDHGTDVKANHTEFMKEHVKFVEVISFNDEAFEKKVHQTFRLTYLKDVVFPRILDDSILGTMGTMIFMNSVQLVTHFFTSKLTENLFVKMRSPELPTSVLSDCLKLIIELCAYSISLESRNRFLFYRTLVTNGLFDVIEHTLANPEFEIRKSSAVILLNTIDFDPTILRSFLIERNQTGNHLFKLIIETFVGETHYVTKTLLYEVLRGSLDTLHIGPDETALNQIVEINQKLEEEKSNVMSIFYQEFALTLFSPLFNQPPELHSPVDTFLKSSLCDLLATFIDHQPQQTKVFIMKNNILPKIFILLKCTEKNLKLGPIRVLRRIISSPNKFYHNYVIENNLFAPVMEVFLANGDKYNALNSAILDLFHYIGINKSCLPLVKYFVENFYDKVQDITYVQTFKNLSILNETPEYYMEEDKFAVDSIREKNRKKFQEEEKEESWFDSDDDYSISTNMIIEDLNSLEPKPLEKRKYEEASSGDNSLIENVEANPANVLTDSPRPKRLKYSNSTGSLQL